MDAQTQTQSGTHTVTHTHSHTHTVAAHLKCNNHIKINYEQKISERHPNSSFLKLLLAANVRQIHTQTQALTHTHIHPSISSYSMRTLRREYNRYMVHRLCPARCVAHVSTADCICIYGAVRVRIHCQL